VARLVVPIPHNRHMVLQLHFDSLVSRWLQVEVQQFGNVSNENEIAFCVRLLNLTGLLIIGSINASRNAWQDKTPGKFDIFFKKGVD
jgi:hypothetical protein